MVRGSRNSWVPVLRTALGFLDIMGNPLVPEHLDFNGTYCSGAALTHSGAIGGPGLGCHAPASTHRVLASAGFQGARCQKKSQRPISAGSRVAQASFVEDIVVKRGQNASQWTFLSSVNDS